MTHQDRIAELKRNAIPSRLERGAEVLGRLWKAQIRCGGGWGRACHCGSAQTDFCRTKGKWLALLQEYHGGELPYGLTGQEEYFIIEAMTVSTFEASGLTALVEVLEGRKPIRIGRGGGSWQTIVDFALLEPGFERNQAIEAVVKIQNVFK